MKKFLLILAISLFSLCTYATPSEDSIDIDGLTVFKLNSLSVNRFKIYGHTSGAITAGICRIIIRSNHREEAFSKLAERFNFIHQMAGMPEEEVSPIITTYALMFKLRKVDFGFESITLVTKNGKSIGENISDLFGDTNVAVLAGTCYAT